MQVNQQNLRATMLGFQTIYNRAFAGTKPLYERIATIVPSQTREEDYRWLGRLPRMREWVGDRVVQNLMQHSYTIRNRDFELTVGVDRNDIEDDTLGTYSPLFEAMGQAAALHPDDLIFELLMLGFNSICYDGRPFFDQAHPTGDQIAQSNAGTAPLSSEAYNAAYAAMQAFYDEHGVPLGIQPGLLVVPPQLRATALEITKAEKVDGTTNVNRDSAEVLVVPRLAAMPKAWFLLDVNKPVKPLIFQRRKAPQFVTKDAPTDENVFSRKEFLYGVDSRDNAGFGLWQLAYGSTGEGEGD